MIPADWRRVRSRLLLFVACAALVACTEHAEHATFEVVVSADEVCVNPTLRIDGAWWETDDMIPRFRIEAGAVAGTLTTNGDVGEFRTDFGMVLQYRRVTGFSKHPCWL